MNHQQYFTLAALIISRYLKYEYILGTGSVPFLRQRRKGSYAQVRVIGNNLLF